MEDKELREAFQVAWQVVFYVVAFALMSYPLLPYILRALLELF